MARTAARLILNLACGASLPWLCSSLQAENPQPAKAAAASYEEYGVGEYDAVLVRDSAISSDQGRLFVLTIDATNKTVYRPIKIGPIVDGLRVVREGLSAGDRVIVSGLMSSRPGVPVQPQTVVMSTNILAAAAAPNAPRP